MSIVDIIIGALIPITTFIVTKIFEHHRLKIEGIRWFGGTLLELKIDGLKTLYNQMQKCFNTYILYWDWDEESLKKLDYYQIFLPMHLEFIDTLTMAAIYLDHENKGEDKIFTDVLSYFGKINDNLVKNKPLNDNLKLEEFNNLRKKASERMKELLNPKKLRKYVENL